jgi:hypothetical protein
METTDKSSVGTPLDYTYVVDSDIKLEAWANNPTAANYTSVLIKKGTWSLVKQVNVYNGAAIDLDASSTKRIVGEAGSKLVFDLTGSTSQVACIKGKVDGTAPNLVNPGADHSIDGVILECIGAHEVYGFSKCANVTNCEVTVIRSNVGTGLKQAVSHGFNECTNLINCIGNSKATGTSTSGDDGVGDATGFISCTNLINCTGKGEATGNASAGNTGTGIGRGFQYCYNLVNCTGEGKGTGSGPGVDYGNGYGFHSCRHLTNCVGSGTGFGTTVVGYGFYNCHSMTLNGPSAASTSGGPYASNCTVGYSSGGTPADTAAGGWNRTVVISPKDEEAEREHESPPEPAVK